MSYIAYLDLLGTKGFCEEEDLYYKNINRFSTAVELLSPIIGDAGRIGIFSDCVYIECSQIDRILHFLTELRLMLIGDELFFNAALTEGELGVESINASKTEVETSESNIFGVRFTNKEIAGIYCKQTAFRGVGIWIDPQLLETIENSDYQIVKSVYFRKENRSGHIIFEPNEYYDISLFGSNVLEDSFNTSRKKLILSIIIKTLYTSHCKSRNYSSYYVSLLINIIRSSCKSDNIQWNRQQKTFEKGDIVFDIIYKFLYECNSNLKNLVGLDNMVLAFLNEIYTFDTITPYDKSDITEKFMQDFECLKNNYMYCLDAVPDEPFIDNNRKTFINICNDNMAGKFVDNIIDSIKA